MRITRDELIEELKKIPTNCEIEFKAFIKTRLTATTDKVKFDRIIFSNPAVVGFSS